MKSKYFQKKNRTCIFEVSKISKNCYIQIINHNQMKNIFLFITLAFSMVFFSCNTNKPETVETKDSLVVYKKQVPEWSKNATIYEVNIRQYTTEGTFNAFATHIPRLKELGVDILWIMPIHPIGLKNRKLDENSLGSAYSVQDYLKVNPDYGTLEDFKALVKLAHQNGMKVIIDWVANHSAWDNVWATTNPDFYTLNEKGEMTVPAGTDWEDTADLNYDNDSLRTTMINAMKFWIQEADIDGYRCDVAGMVPVDFWDAARAELDKIKPVFMLAEAEEPPLHKNAFDMGYAWGFHHIMKEVAQGKKNVTEIDKYFNELNTRFSDSTYLMYFITNHDENSWNGTIKESMGIAANAMAVLEFTVPGMPLIYTGQEVGLDHRLSFFGKDSINWKKVNTETEFYKSLVKLRKENPALWSGQYGGKLERIKTNTDNTVFAFSREMNGNKVITVLNLTKAKSEIQLTGKIDGDYTEYFTKEVVSLKDGAKFRFPAWSYKIFIKK